MTGAKARVVMSLHWAAWDYIQTEWSQAAPHEIQFGSSDEQFNRPGQPMTDLPVGAGGWDTVARPREYHHQAVLGSAKRNIHKVEPPAMRVCGPESRVKRNRAAEERTSCFAPESKIALFGDFYESSSPRQ